jgi:NADH-ubiquinone oxidoreductase chain 6
MSTYLNIILELIIVYCAIKVFDVKNPIGSILFLVGLFGSASIYFYIKGLPFMSLSFIIVYIGAISILFVFIIMLLDIRTSEILNDNSNSIPLATMISGFLGYFFFTKVWKVEDGNSVIKERNNYIFKVSNDN